MPNHDPAFSKLNPQQLEAVKHHQGPLMILAGAGTGKTRVITMRISHMLSLGISPESIVAMTFTNKAASEMKSRISELVGEKKAKKIWVSTFHRFCLNQLRKWPEEAQVSRHFSLVGTSDQLDIIKRILEEKGILSSFKPEQWLQQISACKNMLLSPEDLQSHQTDHLLLFLNDPQQLEIFRTIYDHYERNLRLNRAIDFDDCIVKFVRLLRQHPNIKEQLQQSLRFLLVDEFQDTNQSQFVILSELAEKHHNICVVGDDDQSIYSWRGAMAETLEKFEAIFPNTKLIKLEQNYRSSNPILEIANNLIRHNKLRKDKTLWSQNTSTIVPTLCACYDNKDEARYIAESCLSLMGQGHQPKDIAILYRTNPQSKFLEMALKECRIPFKTFGGTSFFERREVKDFICYVRLIFNPNDHLALWRVLNTPPRGIGIKTREDIEQLAQKLNVSPFEVIRRLAESKTNSALLAFVDSITSLADFKIQTAADLNVLGKRIINEFGLIAFIKKTTQDENRCTVKIEHLQSLPAWLESLGERSLKDNLEAGVQSPQNQPNIPKILDQMTLDNDFEEQQKELEKNQNHVSLMTIHAAKGLEFPAVIIAGIEEELLPHKNSINSPLGLSEERRLFYVAMTRAKEKLFMCYSRERQSGYQKSIRKKSRFLSEMGSVKMNFVDRTGLGPVESKDERKNKTLSRLSEIKQFLTQESEAKSNS